MPIVYKQHLDERDGTIYPCVLMPDGKWWSAINLAWAGAGMYYNNDPAIGAIYGRLYDFVSAVSAVPNGSHLPTDGEWTNLENAIPSLDQTRLKSKSGWRQNVGTDDYGFSALPGGSARPVAGSNGYSVGTHAFFWTATATVSHYLIDSSTDNVKRDSDPESFQNVFMSVRFIVDVFNEQVPPTKIKGTFSGSGVKVFAAMPSDSTFEVPLWAQSTTELTISKDFITKWGAAIGRVRILVVDGEHISEWKDWDFRI